MQTQTVHRSFTNSFYTSSNLRYSFKQNNSRHPFFQFQWRIGDMGIYAMTLKIDVVIIGTGGLLGPVLVETLLQKPKFLQFALNRCDSTICSDNCRQIVVSFQSKAGRRDSICKMGKTMSLVLLSMSTSYMTSCPPLPKQSLNWVFPSTSNQYASLWNALNSYTRHSSDLPF